MDTSQQPFSSWRFDKMKALFGLKADDYNELPTFVGAPTKLPIANLFALIYGGEIKSVRNLLDGKVPVDWTIKGSQTS
ncbi:uncharacterized protein OCT59_014319 [Rhizophagus irregularis]|uniref:uncharacterized protein n=1 Tax=Rhizophagus irregularis TaxID=588596 RepID=UPI0019EB0BB0|nr:hypothetical protein OCT59_014319 [Rhizophagus irregularis]GBC44683.2 hypothetical protein GLOIN_2v1571020 [Rhizophagus irregularis DAOM 181602=DAOM 197198]